MSAENSWNASLCHCTNDWKICCYGWLCTPCLFGSNVEKLEKKSCCLWCTIYCVLGNCYLCWIPHLFKRKNLRQKYNLKEEPANDLLITLCCSPCALCQEAREMKSRENQETITFENTNNDVVIVQQPRSFNTPNY